MVKRILAGLCLVALALGCVGCGSDAGQPTTASVSSSTTQPQTPKGNVRYVNPDPSLQAAWEQIGRDFTAATGHSVQILTPEQAKNITPTLFTVTDEQDLALWADVCVDLAGERATHHFLNWDLALYDGDKMCGLPLEAQGYGLIYNDELLRKAGVTAADINSFAKLREVVNNIAANTSLKVKPFACFDADSEAAALLAAMPGDLRPFWDLYINNAAKASSEEDDCFTQIAEGDAVFCIGSTWEFEILANMSEGNLNIMPLYIGMEGETQQGLCVRVENYLCVRSDIAPLDRDATLAFLDYLTHPEDDKVPIDTLGVFTPYSTANYCASPMERTFRDHIAGKRLVVFSNLSAPEGFCTALLTYAVTPTDENWAAVTATLG